MTTKITVKDFFLQVGAIVAFYASITALIFLVFRVINVAFPAMRTALYYGSSSISLQVATLIVAFPIFLLLSWLLQKSYAEDASRRESGVRKFLSYITLFIAGAIIAGDLITVIYMFLDGQEFTTGFILKVLALLVIAGGVFAYYLREVRNVISPKERNWWRIGSVILILAAIICGFAVVGSPATARAIRYDQERVSDLQNIQWQIVNFYQQKGYIPGKLSELTDSISGFTPPVDPETGEAYEYTLIGQSAKAFELCAIFNRETPGQGEMPVARMPYGPGGLEMENWNHSAGHYCFQRAIDPQLYPVRTQ